MGSTITGQLFKAATLSTLFSGEAEAGTSNNENSLVQANGQSPSFSQVAQQVVGRSLNVRPTGRYRKLSRLIGKSA